MIDNESDYSISWIILKKDCKCKKKGLCHYDTPFSFYPAGILSHIVESISVIFEKHKIRGVKMDPKLLSEIESEFKSKSDADTSDNITVFIGLSLMALGTYNAIADVPDAFIIGASLAGFFFTTADIVTLYWSNKLFIATTTAMGVYCFFLLPISLLGSSPRTLDTYNAIGDMGTFIALGLVMVSIATRSRRAKMGYARFTAEILERLLEENEFMKEEINLIAKEHEKRRKELDNQKEDLSK